MDPPNIMRIRFSSHPEPIMRLLLLIHFLSLHAYAIDHDVVIYGGTSAAITAAVQAKKLGKSVVIVSPDKHLGGLSSGGLGFTDTGDKSVIGGLSREFYHRVWMHYDQADAWKWQKKEEYGNKGQGTPAIDGKDRTMWIFEPHVAEKDLRGFRPRESKSPSIAMSGSTVRRAWEKPAGASLPSPPSAERPTRGKCSSTRPMKAT